MLRHCHGPLYLCKSHMMQGHKKAQDEMVAGGDTEEKYNIIKSEDDDKA